MIFMLNFLTITLDSNLRFSRDNIFRIFSPGNRIRLCLFYFIATVIAVFARNRKLDEEYLFLLFLLIMYIFYSLAAKPLFFDHGLSKLVSTFWAIFACGISSLLFEYNLHTQAAFYWFVTTAVILIVYVQLIQLSYFTVNSKHLKELNTPEEMLFFIESFVILINYCKRIHNSFDLLNNLYKHRTMCDKADCPIKELMRLVNSKMTKEALNEEIIK